VRHVVKLRLAEPELQVHLLNVQTPLPRHISQFLGPRTRGDHHRDRAEAALAPARAILATYGVRFEEHTKLGRKAETIVEEAKRLGCDHIVMSTARKNSLTRMLEDSTTNKVLELTDLPVELIAGDRISPLEQYGVPVGIGAALALLIAAAVD
jgi:nucleotide-binding universal stress UspA family protein